MNKQTINQILEAAVRAPSGDNVQPWEIQVSESFTEMRLFNLPEKDNSYYNYDQIASYIAHGAVIENIMIAANNFGYLAQVSLFPDKNETNLIATLALTKADKQDAPLYHAIFERHTNRFLYKRAEITEEMLKALSTSTEVIATSKVSLVHQSDEIKNLSKELMVNDRLVFERKDIHHFLFDKIRWTQKQIESTQDGMSVDTLGLNFGEKLFFPLMRFWWYVKIGNFFGLSKIIALKCWWNCRNASILGMISIKGNDKVAFVQGGRAMQRLWLEATSQGLALQPIIGLTLLIEHLKQNELQGFSVKHSKFVQRAAITLPKLFGTNEDETLIMGFRLGKGGMLDAKTKRKKIIVK